MSHPWNEAHWALTRRFEGQTFDAVEADLRTALAAEGFGILTEIDVQATLKKKLGVDRRPYKILGACNPALADQAIAAVPAVGLFLPCNAVITEDDDGTVRAALLSPKSMLGPMGDVPGLEPMMADAQARLERALASL